MSGITSTRVHLPWITPRRFRVSSIYLLSCIATMLLACSDVQTPQPTQTPEPTAIPTIQAVATQTPRPSPTLSPTDTPVSTATAIPALTTHPTSTFEPTQTPTPAATATLTATAQPSSTPTPLPTHTPNPTSTSQPTHTPTPEPFIAFDADDSTPAITIGDIVFDLEIAFTPETRTQGLSDRESLPLTTGMLFVFENARTPTFWMYNMRFDLDFIWVGSDCTVRYIHVNVPRPSEGQTPGDLPRYSPNTDVLYNLEINAGLAELHGIEIGDKVSFSGFSGTGAVCQ